MRVMLVDDDKADRLAFRHAVQSAPFELELLEAHDLEHARRIMFAGELIDAVVLDYRLSAGDGLTLLREIRERESATPEHPGLPVIVLTGCRSESVAVEAMKAGATDYIPKGELTCDRVTSAIRTGLELHRRRAETARARAELEKANHLLEERVERRTRDLRQAMAELERRNAELDEFTFVASHDLQEPLRKLIAFSNLLPRDLGGDLPANAQKDLTHITNSARRMQALVQDLLALSRAGKSTVQIEPVLVQRCVSRAIAALAMRIEETGAQITNQSVLPVVNADITMLTQVYQNLIGNALKFVPNGRRPHIELTAVPRDDVAVLGVRDNGIGINPVYAEQIFAPFKRLHGAGEYEGTGIGLSICRKYVERLGGKIWVESQEGQGAHFRFELATPVESQACCRSTEPELLSC